MKMISHICIKHLAHSLAHTRLVLVGPCCLYHMADGIMEGVFARKGENTCWERKLPSKAMQSVSQRPPITPQILQVLPPPNITTPRTKLPIHKYLEDSLKQYLMHNSPCVHYALILWFLSCLLEAVHLPRQQSGKSCRMPCLLLTIFIIVVYQWGLTNADFLS
jgi:hypothetical protein